MSDCTITPGYTFTPNANGDIFVTAEALNLLGQPSVLINNGILKLAHLADDFKLSADYLADNAVTEAKIQEDAVTGAKIADGAILTGHIADSQITADKIANATITQEKLAEDCVGLAQLKDEVYTTFPKYANIESLTSDGTALASNDYWSLTQVIKDTEFIRTIQIWRNTSNGLTSIPFDDATKYTCERIGLHDDSTPDVAYFTLTAGEKGRFSKISGGTKYTKAELGTYKIIPGVRVVIASIGTFYITTIDDGQGATTDGECTLSPETEGTTLASGNAAVYGTNLDNYGLDAATLAGSGGDDLHEWHFTKIDNLDKDGKPLDPPTIMNEAMFRSTGKFTPTSNFRPSYAFDDEATDTGTAPKASFRVVYNSKKNTKGHVINVDVGTPKLFNGLLYQNYHDGSASGSVNAIKYGFYEVDIYGCNNVYLFTKTDIETNEDFFDDWTLIKSMEFEKHPSNNEPDFHTEDFTDNQTAYQYYCFHIKSNYLLKETGKSNNKPFAVRRLTFMEYVNVAAIGNYYSVTTLDDAQIDCSSWGELPSVTINETPHEQEIYYAFNFAADTGHVREDWKVFESGEWKQMVKLIGAVWKYRSADGVYTDAGVNNQEYALSQAIASYTNNKMSNAQISAFTPSNWSATGGFSSGNTLRINAAVIFRSTNETLLPKVDEISFNADSWIKLKDSEIEIELTGATTARVKNISGSAISGIRKAVIIHR